MPVQQLPAEAPDFTLDHVLGHPVSLSEYRGRTVVVVFGGKDSAEQVKQGIDKIRRTHDPDELPVIGVSDLQEAPRAARIIVKSQLKKALEEAVADQSALLEAAGKPPAEPKDVIMLLDWKGEVVSAYGLTDVGREAAAVVIDGDGRILGSATGENLGDETLAILSAQ